jgi:DNA modification methylase
MRDAILKADPEVQPLLRTVLSSILIKTSFRESDTSNHRSPTQRPPGTTLTLFHKKARLLGRALEMMPAKLPTADISRGDARITPAPHKVGLILTSPPYPGVYDYLPMQQLRYAWLDLKPGRDYTNEIGSRRDFRARGRGDALKVWQADTEKWIATQASMLSKGGRMVDTLYPTVEAMEATGMRIIARASADRPDHARGATRIEHLVMGEKQ